jgi:hypothetical protein
MYTWHVVNVGRICVGLTGNRVDVRAAAAAGSADDSRREASVLCKVRFVGKQ